MWNEIYKSVIAETVERSPYQYFFRGHSNANWKLLPSLGRLPAESQVIEESLYFHYQTSAGSLLSENSTSWDVAISMQHHGLPTRLLDWTDSFAVALYFALREMKQGDACVWIMNPFTLNKSICNENNLPNVIELKYSYSDFFSNKTERLEHGVRAIAPQRHNPRAFNQKSLFTVHANIESAIEDLCKNAVTKIIIPEAAKEDAWVFLDLAGISEFSLFPDLDGLARDIKRQFSPSLIRRS